jgi:hypothetical protein
MNIRPFITLELAARHRLIDIAGLVDDVGRVGRVGFRRLFDHDPGDVQKR